MTLPHARNQAPSQQGRQQKRGSDGYGAGKFVRLTADALLQSLCVRQQTACILVQLKTGRRRNDTRVRAFE